MEAETGRGQRTAGREEAGGRGARASGKPVSLSLRKIPLHDTVSSLFNMISTSTGQIVEYGHGPAAGPYLSQIWGTHYHPSSSWFFVLLLSCLQLVVLRWATRQPYVSIRRGYAVAIKISVGSEASRGHVDDPWHVFDSGRDPQATEQVRQLSGGPRVEHRHVSIFSLYGITRQIDWVQCVTSVLIPYGWRGLVGAGGSWLLDQLQTM